MNPLTQIKNTQKISRQEIAAGVSESQSWHARFKHSAYIYAGGLPYNLTDGDLLAVFSQYGEVIDVNLVRHTDTGKSRGFAFLAYEDQRSTNLAVDNLNGAKIGGRITTVDHVDNYRRKIAEVEGREASESEDEPEAAAPRGETAVMDEAILDGAQVVSTSDAQPQADSRDNQDPGDAPWASKSSVYALLNSDVPTKGQQPATEEEEDPLAAIKAHKKHKKEDKRKRKKEEKKREKDDRPSRRDR